MSGPAGPRPGRLIALLAMVSLVGYALRSNITIAQEYLAPDLGLTMADMGTISAWGFQLAYALFQLPGGILADRYGSRVVLTIAILGWAVASFASGLVAAGTGAFVALFGARILLGVSQAATYPVGAMAITENVPPDRRATANSVFIAFALLGSALAPLTLAPLMARAGWRAVFLASGAVGLVAAALWYFLAPVAPRPAGRASLGDHARAGLRLLGDRDLLLLSIAYFLHSAVFFVFIFWFFRYLIDGRGFDLLASGVWGSIPSFTAFLLAPLGGLAADRLSRHGRPGTARRRVAVGCLTAAAALVLIGANVPGALPAIAALSLSVAAINAAEGSFWATATALGRANAGAAGGVMNLMGNLGGVVSIWAVPRMRDPLGWPGLLAVWAGVALVAALLWFAVRVERTNQDQR
ncbi:MAG: MFS transporter [Gemmatimonadales bacterium]